MLFTNKNAKKNLRLSLFLILSLILFAACSSDSSSNTNSEETNTNSEEMEHSDEGEHIMEEGTEHEMEHEHDEERIANPDGAAITILTPEDGATFKTGDEVIVEVQVDNFALGENDNHWHVYVDGTSWGMVMGGNTSQSLQGIEAGEHEIATYLAGGDHIEFEDGSTIHIVVE
jgi:ABC-type Fe3+-hydroxamate transport system substrate-binding protein